MSTNELHTDKIIQIYERTARLETKIDDVNNHLEEVMNNHLPHIEERLAKLENLRGQLFVYGTIIVFIIQLAVAYILKKV